MVEERPRFFSEPVKKAIREIPKKLRHASAPVLMLTEKLKKLKRDYNESFTVIGSVWNSGCGIGVVTV